MKGLKKLAIVFSRHQHRDNMLKIGRSTTDIPLHLKSRDHKVHPICSKDHP